ncbi:hypothetical protein AnigIFM50267_007728 [Aspergillus niger]|uniref:Salicylate hydroxylase n=1 Tax=Aspergillus welwitschiae TaxID=1341132 RepID=A0A3F3PXD1_9EURO|nr:salicylate hydroxylase [Aspergillus welwitschiae]RDH31422.1 salicylate hydroxylase [Aspergillus welwitschiae]GKZ71686.1 hypothetical protein AnigIFM50267_007728 [Aspergillus niger]
MRVIIIGGDVSAFVCAITCRRDNLDVIVLESGQDTETPPGIQIPPNGTYLLRRLGLLDAVLEKGDIVQTIDFRRYSDGGVIRSMPCGEDTCRIYGGPWITIHREDLRQILRDRARKLGTEIRPATVREVYSETAEVILEDGESLQGDVVIKADGNIASKSLSQETSSPSTATETETIYQTTISRKHLEALNNPKIDELWQGRHSTTAWLGPNQHAIFYPVRHGQTYILNIYHTNTDSKSTTIPTAQEICTGWDNRLQTILSLNSTLKPTTLSYHNQAPTQPPPQSLLTHLPTQNIPIPPHQAQETATVIEDALTLSTLLSLYNQHQHQHSYQSHLPSLLALHATLRSAITTQKIHSALSTLRAFQLENGIAQQARDWVLSGAGITRDTDGWWKVMSSRQEGVLGGGMELVDETGRAFWEWKRARGVGLGEGKGSSGRSSCGIGGLRRKWYAWF